MGSRNRRRRPHGSFAEGITSDSSTAPPANSPVENRDYMKIGRVKHMLDPVVVTTTIKTVTQAITEIYAQGSTDTPFEHLYRHVYFLVLHKKGDELYSEVEATMASEVQSLFRSMYAAPEDEGALFLQELMVKWNQHIQAVKMTQDVLLYMDRTFVATNRKAPIKELGIHLWRDHLTSSSGKIRQRLIEAVKRRGGEDDELVAAVNKMLRELGEDVPGLFFPDGELHVAGP